MHREHPFRGKEHVDTFGSVRLSGDASHQDIHAIDLHDALVASPRNAACKRGREID